MSKQLKVSISVLALLVLVAVATWGWYFATREPQRVVGRPGRQLPGQNREAIKWRSTTQKERYAATKSIIAQLEAFKADRYEIATRFQSEALKNNFSSVENFRRVIQEAYPQFARYKSAKFGATTASADSKWVRVPVELTGQDGVKVSAIYEMTLEGGIYRVAGVSGGITRPPTSDPDAHPEPALPPGVRKIAASPNLSHAL